MRRTLKDARRAAGLSINEATFAVRAYLPRQEWVSPATIQRIEAEGVGPKTDRVLVSALCELYGVSLEAVAPDLVADVRLLADLLKRASGCIHVEAA